MLISFDTKDLINVVDEKAGIEFVDFNSLLRSGGHRIVISAETALELSFPLLDFTAKTNVMGFLLRLEKLPLSFLNEARISPLELSEAGAAFEEGREYDPAAVDPFVDRFDACIRLGGRPYNEILRSDLADTIWILWREDPSRFANHLKVGQGLGELIARDRALSKKPALSRQFVRTVKADLTLYRIREPRAGLTEFANWIYASPARCPGLRLGYEVYHQIVKNKSARARPSDFVDLTRFRTVPYVDLFTTDLAMLGYARQASRAIGASSARIASDFKAVLSLLRE